MRLRLRLLWLLLSALWRRPVGVLETATLALRVLPNDTDITKVSGDRYATLGELGWADWLIRTGTMKTMLRRGYAPVGRICAYRFRYPLWMFQAYNIHTKLVWWNESAIFFEHHFERQGRTIALAYTRGSFLKGKHAVSTYEGIPALASCAAPVKPAVVLRLEELDTVMASANVA